MDNIRFEEACRKVIRVDYQRSSIGILKEKTLHAVLKHYFEPHAENHEIKVGGFVADIVGEQGIIEIQTQGFDKLRKKLAAFLEACPVTIVYPVAAVKWLSWVDEDSGEAAPLRRSPKKGTAYEVFWELYKIRSQLTHPNLKICVVLLELEEYRYLNGWSKDRKRGSSRCDRIPVRFIEELYLDNPETYRSLLSDKLPEQFTVKDLAKEQRILANRAQCAVSVMREIGVVELAGKQGRAHLYRCI